MDLSDIIKILGFIYIFVVLPARKRKSAQERRAKQGASSKPLSRNKFDKRDERVSEPVQSVDSRVKRIFVEEREHPTTKVIEEPVPKQQVDWQQVYTSKFTERDRTAEVLEEKDKENKVERRRKDILTENLGISSIDKQDIVKGIIMAEILQPPVSRRPKKRRIV